MADQSLLAFAVTAAAFLGIVVTYLAFRPGRKLRQPPWAPRQIPGIGDLFAFMGKEAPKGYTERRHKELGAFFRAYLGFNQVVCVGDGDSIKKILMSEEDWVEVHYQPAIAQLTGEGAINNLKDPKTHAAVRKLLAPRFLGPQNVGRTAERMAELAEAQTDEWLQKGQISGVIAMKRYTFEIAIELVMGLDRAWLDPERLEELRDLFGDWLEGFTSPIALDVSWTAFGRGMNARRRLLKLLDEAMEDLTDATGDDANTMEVMLNAKVPGWSKQGVKSSLLTFLFAGHDTSASTLMVATRFLKQHPEALTKLRAEQAKVMATHGKQITAAVLKDMVYTEAVVRETMRLVPVVGVLIRKALKDFEVKGYHIPKAGYCVASDCGCLVVLSLWKAVKEDPRWAQEEGPLSPDNFYPDRWLSEEGRKDGDWIPFGTGPRRCLGSVFAVQEMKVLLAVMARKIDWTVDLDEPVTSFPLWKPLQGMPMKITPHKA
eukprot:jgi/Astpho2/7227/Aster-01537